jgi:hypothetical protein
MQKEYSYVVKQRIGGNRVEEKKYRKGDKTRKEYFRIREMKYKKEYKNSM